jgi:predicted nucleotidyltransferase component of viral defense system
MSILSPFQEALVKQVGNSALNDMFFLTGGTALSAFFLQHRYSEDLDFFTDQPEAVPQVLPILEQIAQQTGARIEIRRQFKTFLEIFLHGQDGEVLKCDFAETSPYRLQPKARSEEFGIFLDSALDISCNKLSALFDRSATKDFVDVYFIDREMFKFSELLENAKQKHIGLDDYWLAISLLKAEELDPLPRMIKPVTIDELKNFFLAQARILMK